MTSNAAHSARRVHTAAVLLLAALLPTQAHAQELVLDSNPGELLLDKEVTHLLDTRGPAGGMVVDLAYGPGEGTPKLYALTEAGVYQFKRDTLTWASSPIQAPDDVLLPPVPIQVDMAHLTGDHGLYTPSSVSLLIGDSAHVMSELGLLYTAPITGGSWRNETPGDSTAFGPIPFSTASRLSIDLDAGGRPMVLRSDQARPDPNEQSRVWWNTNDRWRHQDLPGRAALIHIARGKIGASWRYEGLARSITYNGRRYQVERFIRPEADQLSEITWAKLLEESPSEVREGCWDATGMMEAQTQAGDGEPSVIVAIGSRTLCTSTDDGASFQVRDTLLKTRLPGEVIGHMIAATMFTHAPASSGVRILVGTESAFNPVAPRTRVRGGRLFLSDDAGETWRDITPDADAPGGFIDLESTTQGDPNKTEVWLLTERRGAYRSANSGEGFDQVSLGLSAQPIHMLAVDPLEPDKVYAASPTGFYRISGSAWSQSQLIATRSIGTVWATPDDLGQLWTGTYWGQVLIRGQDNQVEAENLPKPDPLDPALKAQDVRTSIGQLARPIPISPPMRPVVVAAPADLVNKNDAWHDRGYALIEGEGLFCRLCTESNLDLFKRKFRLPLPGPDPLAALTLLNTIIHEPAWERIPLPMSEPIQILSMSSVPLSDGGPPAVVLLLVSDLEAPSGGIAWMYVPLHPTKPAAASGWQSVPLPIGAIPETAVRIGERIWIATTTGALQELVIADRRISIGRTLKIGARCVVLSALPDGGLGCATSGADPGRAAPEPAAPKVLAHVLKLPGWVVGGAPLAEDEDDDEPPRTVPHVASNPLGRNFAPPMAMAWSKNPAGEHPWISTGFGVYTTVQSIYPGEAPDPPKNKEGGGAWLWIMLGFGLLGALGAWATYMRYRTSDPGEIEEQEASITHR